jgi:hypothetical protein
LWSAGKGGGANVESDVHWTFARVVREEVACFAGDSMMGRVDKAFQGGKCMADGVDGVPDVVADLFAVFALKEGVTKGVEWFAALSWVNIIYYSR